MATITKTFTIEKHQIDAVIASMKKLNKKAVKLGLAPAEMTTEERIEKKTKKCQWTGKTITTVRPVLDCTMTATEIKFGDYTHVATLDHAVGGEMPIVNVVPNQHLPAVYRTATPHCDHCNTDRYRKNTFVFVDGENYRQVGSSCLKEYFGIDPTQAINWFSSFYDIAEEEEELSGAFTQEMFYSNTTLISIAMAIVERTGFVSAKQAKESDVPITSTASATKFVMFPPARLNADTRAYISEIWNRADALKSDADAMIAWGKAKFENETSDYAHNMRIFLDKEYTTEKYFGYTISLISAHKKEIAETTKNKITASDNEYIGNVGDKIATEVAVVKIIPSEGFYGTTYINIMLQQKTGNNIVWMSSNNVLEEGKEITLKGTIKAHNSRDGKNQTIMARCKVA